MAVRIFTAADQTWFANLSGDSNPMHMDPLAARRTQAGAPVVHGVHMLLWLLEQVAIAHPGLPPPGSLKLRFDKMAYLGDAVEAVTLRAGADGAKAEIRQAGATLMRLAVGVEPPRPAGPPGEGEIFAPASPRCLGLQEMERQAGRVAFAHGAAAYAAAFPKAAAWCGGHRLAALGASTRLVGMVCPGLHSIFGGLTLQATSEGEGDQALHFQVERVDARFRAVRLHIQGGGLAGMADAFVRHPPVAQAPLSELATHVPAGAFAGKAALIIGGSRGLGEVCAKLLAAGGARVGLTYARGKADAEAVVDELRAHGAEAFAMPFDATTPAAPQLAGLPFMPSLLAYMATPPIFQPKAGFFNPARFAAFSRIYVDGFWEAFSALRERNEAIAALYPSSVAVEERPPDMTEYAMAKGAGEILCADINAQLAPARVAAIRLPRLASDQTSSLLPVPVGDTVGSLLPALMDLLHATNR